MNGSQKIKNVLVLGLLGFSMFLMARCSVRDRSNIFDPKSGIDTLDMKLNLRSADSVIELNWYPTYHLNFSGYHLYRKFGNQKKFSSLAILKANQNSYRDSTVQYDIPYAYYLTLIGTSGESPPTPVLRTVPGPGKIWLLDRWNEYIFKFSYDLRYTLQTHYAIWVPQSMALNCANSQGLITYPLYHYAELFDLQSGALLGEVTDIRYPYACAFNSIEKGFWITDSSGSLYQFNPQSTTSLKMLDGQLGKPIEIVFDRIGRAFVLDAKKQEIVIFNPDGRRQGNLSAFNGHSFEDLFFLASNTNKSRIYFIDRAKGQNTLFRFSTLTDSLQLVLQMDGMDVVRESPLDGSLWIAVNLNNSAKILQLSTGGVRLKTLDGFKHIEDFVINPVNGNLVIADRDLHQLINMYQDGGLVGKFSNALYPFKVYIE